MLPSFARLSLNSRPVAAVASGLGGSGGARTRRGKKREEEELEDLARRGQEELDLYSDEVMAPEHLDPLALTDDEIVLTALLEYEDDDFVDMLDDTHSQQQHAASVVASQTFRDDLNAWIAERLQAEETIGYRRMQTAKEAFARELARRWGITPRRAAVAIEQTTHRTQAWRARYGQRRESRDRHFRRAAPPANKNLPTGERVDGLMAKLMQALGRTRNRANPLPLEAMCAVWDELMSQKVTERDFEGESAEHVAAYHQVDATVQRIKALYASGRQRSAAYAAEEKQALTVLTSEEGLWFVKRVASRASGAGPSDA